MFDFRRAWNLHPTGLQINNDTREETQKLHVVELQRLKLAIDAEASQK
jgi:hypothetical protein